MFSSTKFYECHISSLNKFNKETHLKTVSSFFQQPIYDIHCIFWPHEYIIKKQHANYISVNSLHMTDDK